MDYIFVGQSVSKVDIRINCVFSFQPWLGEYSHLAAEFPPPNPGKIPFAKIHSLRLLCPKEIERYKLVLFLEGGGAANLYAAISRWGNEFSSCKNILMHIKQY